VRLGEHIVEQGDARVAVARRENLFAWMIFPQNYICIFNSICKKIYKNFYNE
jgi:hypothetical protein